MKETEPKQASNPTKQVLVFSTRLRQDIQTACRQLENGEGQEDVTYVSSAPKRQMVHDICNHSRNMGSAAKLPETGRPESYRRTQNQQYHRADSAGTPYVNL